MIVRDWLFVPRRPSNIGMLPRSTRVVFQTARLLTFLFISRPARFLGDLLRSSQVREPHLARKIERDEGLDSLISLNSLNG